MPQLTGSSLLAYKAPSSCGEHERSAIPTSMSTTLPPMTGTGVLLRFVFPFDQSLARTATVVWRRHIGGRDVDTHYADIAQSGDSQVVYEQITFPGDCWAVIGADGTLCALHVATGEREQRVLITTASQQAAAAGLAQPAPPEHLEAAAADNEAGNDPELEAAIQESLRTAARESSGAAAAVYSGELMRREILSSGDPEATARQVVEREREAKALRDALALSKRLANEFRARDAGGSAKATTADVAAEPPAPVDVDSVRAARLRRFELPAA